MNYYEKKVLKLIDESESGFTSPEFDGLWGDEYDFFKITSACYNLVKRGVLKKRDCVGLAFERCQ